MEISLTDNMPVKNTGVNPLFAIKNMITSYFSKENLIYFAAKAMFTLCFLIFLKNILVLGHFTNAKSAQGLILLSIYLVLDMAVLSIAVSHIFNRIYVFMLVILGTICAFIYSDLPNFRPLYDIALTYGAVSKVLTSDTIYLFLIPKLKKFPAKIFSFFLVLSISLVAFNTEHIMPSFKTMQLDNITYYTYDDNFDERLLKIHDSLPQKFKSLPIDIHISEHKQFSGLLPEFLSGSSYNIFKVKSKIIIGLKPNEDLSKILTHEITHSYQHHQPFINYMLVPTWKLEGHASLIGKNSSKFNLFRCVFISNQKDQEPSYRLFPFISRFGLRNNIKDYQLAQIQAWYYLDYLKISEQDFFASKTKLAKWSDIRKAMETDKDFKTIGLHFESLIEKDMSIYEALSDTYKHHGQLY